MVTKYKVIKEFDRFYLAESPSGWKETFHKAEYKPDKDGYITKGKYYKWNPNPQPNPKSPWRKKKNIYGNVDTEVLFFEELISDEEND